MTLSIDWGTVLPTLLGGFVSSLKVFTLTLILSVPLGLAVMLLRRSNFGLIRLATSAYISVMRGTPLMLQLIFFFYAPFWIFNISLGNDNWLFICVILSFTINYAAYFGEIFRGSITSIPRGQYEAAFVLGYGRIRCFFNIILPQMVRISLPAVTNEVITLVKDTSLAFVLGYVEMFTLAKNISNTNASPMPLFAAGLFYYIANAAVAFIMGRVEKKFEYYKI